MWLMFLSSTSVYQCDALFQEFAAYLKSLVLAIMVVGEVIQFYDSDRLFLAWGFGGRMTDGTISHCFNLNGILYGVECSPQRWACRTYSLQQSDQPSSRNCCTVHC
ncbi:hypothetical protein Drorol1_Dr00003691 [Drosera rotundifolia]